MEIKSAELRVWLALAVVVLVWGSAFAAIRVALHAYGPGEMALLRLIFASATVAVYALIVRMRLPRLRDLPAIFMLGFVGYGFYYTALNFGEVTTLAGVTSLLIATTPMFAALFSALILKEKLGFKGCMGVLIASTGVVLIIAGQQKSFHLSSGALLILSAAISAAVYFILQQPFFKIYSPLELTTYSMWAGMLLTIYYLPSLYQQWRATSWQATAVVAYLGVFPAALGYVLWNYALSKWPVSRVSSFLYLVPVVGMTGGWLVLHEVPTVLSLCGAPIAITGVYLVNTRKKPPHVPLSLQAPVSKLKLADAILSAPPAEF